MPSKLGTQTPASSWPKQIRVSQLGYWPNHSMWHVAKATALECTKLNHYTVIHGLMSALNILNFDIRGVARS